LDFGKKVGIMYFMIVFASEEKIEEMGEILFLEIINESR